MRLRYGYCVAAELRIVDTYEANVNDGKKHACLHAQTRALHKHLRTGICSPNMSDSCLVVQRIRIRCMSHIPRSLSTLPPHRGQLQSDLMLLPFASLTSLIFCQHILAKARLLLDDIQLCWRQMRRHGVRMRQVRVVPWHQQMP